MHDNNVVVVYRFILRKSVMGIFDFLQTKKSDPALDVSRLQLTDMQKGYMFDYDMLTWQVMARNNYVYGQGETSIEWEIEHANDKRYLMHSKNEDNYCLGKKISFREITPAVTASIIANDGPPSVVSYLGKKFHLEESGTGLFHPHQQDKGQEFVYWELIDEEDSSFISIEQWDERDFTASYALWVERFQFSNILPSALDTP